MTQQDICKEIRTVVALLFNNRSGAACEVMCSSPRRFCSSAASTPEFTVALVAKIPILPETDILSASSASGTSTPSIRRDGPPVPPAVGG